MEYKSCIYDFYSFLASLPDDIETELDHTFRSSHFRDFINKLGQDRQDDALLRISNNLFKLERSIVQYAIERNKEIEGQVRSEMYEQMEKKESQKQMTFSVPEIAELAKRFKVKGKTTTNTIYTHLKTGVLPGSQDAVGNWTAKREDVETYLGRTDF